MMTEAMLTAMQARGWRYDPETNGWRRDDLWVANDQAQRAFDAAEAQRVCDPGLGCSETLAKIVAAGSVNDA